ncbi:MAG: N-acetylmuramoyl-L-alanine amidase [Tepidisphaeraceae bacterium]
MPIRPVSLALKGVVSASMVAVMLAGCAKDKVTTPATGGPDAKALAATPASELGFQARHGDEIMICGRYYRIGAPVVLWTDPGGYDAYRVERRFSPYDQSSWTATTQAMAAGKVKFESKDQEFAPLRYGMRYGADPTTQFSAEEIETIRGGGWPLPLLQRKVDQFVLHFDVAGVSRSCFNTLQDHRGLSVQFMLDIDGTIYQTLDVKERAWQATKSNNRSIGIEIANMGAYGVNQSASPLVQWYEKQPDGRAMITIPERLKGGGVRTPGPFYSRRNEPVVGVIQGSKLKQYDFTPQQYDSLIKLTAALCDALPEIKPDAPRGPDGKVTTDALSDAEWEKYKGILGHYHVQTNKNDPGPAFDWDYFIPAVQERVKQLKAARKVD